ncbi:MAG: hypothetical protein RE471_05035 [Ferroplasma sp.]|uniref:hypothetical protein n=1 Tax=Ferroplasma sp. TaxID=2591003 RepID=UPI002815F247|nr:hypothetical protein [Ferroplasma sp.]WMT52246.1 MAG: hypothetical protein RE471_05035 [Ferroplasma sp.]
MNLEKFLERVYQSRKFYEYVNGEIDNIVQMIRDGYGPETINKSRNPDFKLLLEFARSRIRVSRKFSHSEQLFLDHYSSMYSTPEIVGKYRSERLKGNSIIDAGSGAGMQDIMFSSNSKITGIEMDRSRYFMSMLNRIPYDSSADFINEDFFRYKGDFTGKIIFSDPLRPQNSREKYFSQLSPNPMDIIDNAHGITGYAIDLPPHIKWENIPLKGEKEYISINGNLNRLTLYSTSLSTAESTAVILPQNIKISGIPAELNKKPEPEYTGMDYLILPDISVIYARLLNNIVDPDWPLLYSDSRRYIFAGNSYNSSFPGRQYSIIDYSENLEIERILERIDAGKVFFRLSMDPDETYLYKNRLEKNLSGNKNVYIFKVGRRYIITEEAL